MDGILPGVFGRLTILVLLMAISALAAGPARAGEAGIGNAQPCVAAPLTGGPAVRARERIGESGFMAFARFDPDGWPVITYARSYFSLPPVVQSFLSMHECGHLVLQTTDEVLANCYALAHGRWSRDDLALIALSHRSVGSLPPQYGGSGAVFWERTVRTCPGLAR